jgi:hypothetical protein
MIICIRENLFVSGRRRISRVRFLSSKERPFVAATRQIVFSLERKIFRSHQRLLPLLQKGNIENYRNGRILIQGNRFNFPVFEIGDLL